MSHRSGQEQPFFAWSDLQFPISEYAERRDRLAARLEAAGGGVFLAPSRPGRSGDDTFRQLEDFLYFTGLELPDSMLAIDASGTTTLFVPATDARFESPSRTNDFPGRSLATDPEIPRRSGIDHIAPFEDFAAALKAWAQTGSLWIDPGRMGALARQPAQAVATTSTVQILIEYVLDRAPDAQLRNAFPEVARLRMIKSQREIEALERAAQVTAVAIRHVAGQVRTGVDERTLLGAFEAACRRGGAQRLPFTPIIKSGPNSLWPWRILASHYERRNRRMQAGDLVIVNVACEVDYYISDLGRTFPVAGRFSPLQRELLEMEVAVADAIIAAVRPGTTLAQLRRIAELEIPADHRRYMQTGVYFGHHVGLSSGEPAMEEDPLAPGMVFTVEPWYYNHDLEIAVFTEDVVLVTAAGSRLLSANLPRSPAGLERLVGG